MVHNRSIVMCAFGLVLGAGTAQAAPESLSSGLEPLRPYLGKPGVGCYQRRASRRKSISATGNAR